MKNVFVLSCDWGNFIVGIFSTLEKAEKVSFLRDQNSFLSKIT